MSGDERLTDATGIRMDSLLLNPNGIFQKLSPVTGKGPPDWKTAILVMLGLYPIVMLEMRFLSPHLTSLNPALATFIGNIGSVAATSFITMPLFVHWFGWWLFTSKDSPKSRGSIGVALLIALFVVEIALLWRILP
jgi:uncharacterized protein